MFTVGYDVGGGGESTNLTFLIESDLDSTQSVIYIIFLRFCY